MKRYDYIQFGALSILSHIAQGAAFILLFAAFGGTGTTSSFTFATPVGLALGVVYVSALSFLFGWESDSLPMLSQELQQNRTVICIL